MIRIFRKMLQPQWKDANRSIQGRGGEVVKSRVPGPSLLLVALNHGLPAGLKFSSSAFKVRSWSSSPSDKLPCYAASRDFSFLSFFFFNDSLLG